MNDSKLSSADTLMKNLLSRKEQFDIIVVGAGLSGITLAEHFARLQKKRVLIIEKRVHIGGCAYDFENVHGIMQQKYGPHIFHTNSQKVWAYLNKFTLFNSYSHHVNANVNNKEISLPITVRTMEQLYGKPYTPESMSNYFDMVRIKGKMQNSKDVIVTQVGEELYNLIFKNYSKKLWGVYPDKLDPQVTSRLPVRYSRDTRYFSDAYQGLPTNGFTCMMQKMVDRSGIEILLNTDYRTVISHFKYDKLFFTGSIDEFFDFKFGTLPYRSLKFLFRTSSRRTFQNVAVVNYPNDRDFLRVSEFKHMYMQKSHKTTVCYEYPQDSGDPFYPIPSRENFALYQEYLNYAQKLNNVYFLGRLGAYKYINMDQAVEAAMNLYEKVCA